MFSVQKCLEMGMIQKASLTRGPIGAKVSRNGNDPKSVTDAGPEQPFRCLDGIPGDAAIEKHKQSNGHKTQSFLHLFIIFALDETRSEIIPGLKQFIG